MILNSVGNFRAEFKLYTIFYMQILRIEEKNNGKTLLPPMLFRIPLIKITLIIKTKANFL